MHEAHENLIRAGEIFMYTVWLQSQMTDLIILSKNPHLTSSFLSNEEKVPPEFAQLRAEYWQKHFGTVKEEFINVFSDNLADQDKADLEYIFYTRNMIAHAHVSLARKYMLYRPAGGIDKEQALIDAFKIQPVEDQAKPFMIKIEYWQDDLYQTVFSIIKRLDEICFKRLCIEIKISHGRIR